MMEVGIDLVRISRFEDKSLQFAKAFLTQDEMDLYSSLKEERAKCRFLATRWASKEAIFKATQDLNFAGYSILNEPSGKPYVKEHPELKLSVSHDGDMAIAIVILEK